MTYGYCFRCATNSSVFWHRFGYGCNEAGDNGDPFVLCDKCFQDLHDFMCINMTKVDTDAKPIN